MRERKGFTLIELLAVIVILAVIALIATPIIIGIIEDAKDKANENSAYGIVDSVKYYYTHGMLEQGSVLYDTNVLNHLTYNGQAPKEGSSAYVNEQGQVAVALLYGNKCYKKEYTDSKISLGDVNNCTVDIVVTIGDTIRRVPLVTSGAGLYQTGDDYRFRGGCNLSATPPYPCSEEDPIRNYVSINGQKYRIINMDSQGVKIMTHDNVASLPYDRGTGDTNCTADTCPRNNTNNTFCQASGEYSGCSVYAVPIGGTFTAGNKTGTVTQNSTLYDYLNTSGTEIAVTTLRNVAKNASWNIGAVMHEYRITLSTIQSQEAAAKANFKLGLMNASDYIEGSLDSNCANNPASYNSNGIVNCLNQNWFFNPDSYYSWTINARADTADRSDSVWPLPSYDGRPQFNNAYDSLGVRPAAYIDENIPITGGSGTESDPWVLQV